MGEYFRGWKRKLGLLTLVMACVVTISWIRSFCCSDEIEILVSGNLHSFGSESGQLSWWKMANSTKSRGWFLYSTDKPTLCERRNAIFAEQQLSNLESVSVADRGRQFLLIEDGREATPIVRESAVPHWSIVIPLTGLFRWLLLSKGRDPKPAAGS